jgi:hypothetical protein
MNEAGRDSQDDENYPGNQPNWVKSDSDLISSKLRKTYQRAMGMGHHHGGNAGPGLPPIIIGVIAHFLFFFRWQRSSTTAYDLGPAQVHDLLCGTC